MSDLISQFVSISAQAFAAGHAENLLTTIPLGPSHPYWGPLTQALLATGPNDLDGSRLINFCPAVSTDARETFASLMSAVLKNVRGGQDQAPSGDPGEAYAEFSRILQVYVEVNRLYAMPPSGPYTLHPFLNPLILSIIQNLLPISRRAAALATAPARESKSSRTIQDTTRQAIERSLQVATSPVAPQDWEGERAKPHCVGDIAWSLANVLWRIYAERKLHTQAVELRRNMINLIPSAEQRLASREGHVRQMDVCQSWYWRGRLGVILLDIRGAKRDLDQAWALCPPAALQQRRAILIRLIPINLLLGILPSRATLQSYNLLVFEPLLTAFRRGDIAAWRRELHVNREWYRRRNIWLILFERGEILVWRNLFRLALRCHYMDDPEARPSRCPTRIFISAATSVFAGSGEVEDGTISIEDIICVTSSLIDHGLLLGNLSYSQNFLIMKASPDGFGGFFPVSMVKPREVVAVG